MRKNVAMIIAAAGKSSRFGDPQFKKVFALLNGRAVWLHSVDLFSDHERIGQIIVSIDPADRDMFQEKYAASAAMMGVEIVMGGAERWQSILHAIEKVRDDMEYIAVHDAARPCITKNWVSQVIEGAEQHGAAILATEVTGTLKKSNDGKSIQQTVSRDHLWQAQTPQVFKKEILTKAYAQRGSLSPTDDAQLVEHIGHTVKIIPCSPLNIKITSRDDLKFAELAIKALPSKKGLSFFS